RMKSRPLAARRRHLRAADRANPHSETLTLRRFIRRLANALARDCVSGQSYRSDHDPEYRTNDTPGGNINESGDRFERARANISCGGIWRGVVGNARPRAESGPQPHGRARTR